MYNLLRSINSSLTKNRLNGQRVYFKVLAVCSCLSYTGRIILESITCNHLVEAGAGMGHLIVLAALA